MKNRSLQLLLLMFLFITNGIFAQRFNAGIIAGGVASDLVGVDPYDNDFHKAGFTIGGLLNTKLSINNSAQFEILYTQKGSLQHPDSTNNYKFYKLNLDYIEVPILFKHNFKFNVNKKVIDRFYWEAGPSMGRLIRIKINNNGSIANDGDFRKNEVALNLGIGCAIVDNLLFNIRFSNSIISVVDHPDQINTFFGTPLIRDTIYYFHLR